MKSSTHETGRPIWARPDLFQPAPTEGWGYLSRRTLTQVADMAALQAVLRADTQEQVGLVWTPQSPYLEVPEEIPELLEALQTSRALASARRLEQRRSQLRVGFLLFFAFISYSAWDLHRSSPGWSWFAVGYTLLRSGIMVMAVLGLLMFFLQPWYEEWKRLREVRAWSVDTLRDAGDLARFEIWMSQQKVTATRCLMGLIGLAAAMQIFSGNPYAAALIRGSDERWRLLTAPFLHYNTIHFVMNALGLLYLGRRIETLARWPHVPLVFMFSAWLGGELTMLGTPGVQAMGASGGIMGMLGFLLVFEILHKKLVPRSAKRRLLAALIGTALIGVIGIQFIDNLAHLGGCLAGMAYAAVVFPKSDSTLRPRSNSADRIMAIGCFCFMAYAVYLASAAMWA